LASPTDLHQFILGQLFATLNGITTSQQLGSLRFAPLDVILDEETVVQPDLFFVSKGNQQCYVNHNGKWVGPPDLCIEILSSDARHDRVTKMRQYSQHGVREYWVVDPQQRYIEVYLRSQEGHFYLAQDFGQGDTLTSDTFPGLQLNVTQVFPGAS
jgi:Uma2 family endonuclease